MTTDDKEIVEVFRILRYVGTKKWIEKTLKQGLKGRSRYGPNVIIEEAVLGQFPIMQRIDRKEQPDGKNSR